MVDPRKGRKNSSQTENIHQLRLLHNRYLQLLFANARAEDVLSFQKSTVEVNSASFYLNMFQAGLFRASTLFLLIFTSRLTPNMKDTNIPHSHFASFFG
jgi:hypothetical protein